MKSVLFVAITVLSSVGFAVAKVCTISDARGTLTMPTNTNSGDNGLAVSASCTDAKDSKTVVVTDKYTANYTFDAAAQAKGSSAAWTQITQHLLDAGYSPVSSTLFTK